MVTKKILTILAVVLFSGSGLYAVPVGHKDFYSSGHILPGEEWTTVDIYNDNTIVNMLGGFVDQMQTFDSSMVNIAGGQIYSLYTRESSAANIFGGSVGGVMTWDHATTNLYEGGTVFSLGARGQSGVVNMTGGNVEYLGAIESGILNLYGGLVTNSLGAWDFSVVNIYGYGFDYDPYAGSKDGGQLTGFWLDDTAFSIDLYGLGTYSHINLIPEPSSLILFALGALLIKRKR
jgi:hypothetical protein